jgi:hypothetical protein
MRRPKFVGHLAVAQVRTAFQLSKRGSRGRGTGSPSPRRKPERVVEGKANHRHGGNASRSDHPRSGRLAELLDATYANLSGNWAMMPALSMSAICSICVCTVS